MKFLFSNTAPIITRGMGAAFADLGHQVRFVNVEHEGGSAFLTALDEFQPDFVFTDAGWGNTNHILFPLLHERNIPHIYWGIEDPVFFNHLSLPWARESAYVFTTCLESIQTYSQNGIVADVLPFACHPTYNRTVNKDSRFQHDIAFIGNNYMEHPDRIKAANYVLKPLMDNGFNLKIYGLNWWLDKNRPFYIDPQFYGGYLPNEDFSAICSSVPIILGLHSVVNSTTMMSMRTFEVLGCGGFYLTQWTPAIEHFFKNHHHLVWTKSAEQTIELVNYYLARPDLRAQIARQGQEEVYSKHTYHHRAQVILSKIGSSNVERLPDAAQPRNSAQVLSSTHPGLKIRVGSSSFSLNKTQNSVYMSRSNTSGSKIIMSNPVGKSTVYKPNNFKIRTGIKLKI